MLAAAHDAALARTLRSSNRARGRRLELRLQGERSVAYTATQVPEDLPGPLSCKYVSSSVPGTPQTALSFRPLRRLPEGVSRVSRCKAEPLLEVTPAKMFARVYRVEASIQDSRRHPDADLRSHTGTHTMRRQWRAGSPVPRGKLPQALLSVRRAQRPPASARFL